MIYIFDQNAGDEQLSIKGENFKYLVKVRRHQVGDELAFRTQEEPTTLHKYKVISIEPRVLHLELLESSQTSAVPQKKLHLAWCVIDAKSVEKTLPFLCELGVYRISFVFCQRSQKNFKVDFKRLERIVEASMQQSGRDFFMEFDTYKDVESFIKEYPDTVVFDFSNEVFSSTDEVERVLIGCEGGFSVEEKEFLQTQRVLRLDTPMVLRSETAAVAVASKILL